MSSTSSGFFRQPVGTMPEIQTLWAFMALDPDDQNEGIIAGHFPELGGWMPLIASDRVRIDQLRPFAERLAKERKITVRLVRFSNREALEEYVPL